MAIEVLQKEEISGGGRMERKGVGSAIRRRENRGSVNIRE